MANRLGDPTARSLGRLTLNPLAHIDWIGTVLFPLVAMVSGAPLIGWAKPVPVDFRYLKSPRRDFALVAAAGPASNLVLAIAGSLVHAAIAGKTGEVTALSTVDHFVVSFVFLNILLAVFNMIPVPPLDGGNVAIGVLPPQLGRLFAAMRPWGFLILYALMFTGILWRITLPVESAIAQWLL